ncbi:MAG: scyllo-inosose 3-dehydrogenase [Candidatus Bipolaricaulia bacterium]
MKALVLEAERKPRQGYQLSEFEKQTGKAVEGSQVWKNPRLVLKDVNEPKLGPRDLRLRVRAVGICGSDVHFYETDDEGYMFYPGLTKFPVTIGHEFAGEVVEVGDEATDFAVGDRVTVEEMVWCGTCRPCRDGFPNHCVNLEEIGFTIDGADAEFIVVPAKLCWKVDAIFERYSDEETAWEVAATCEPTSVAYNTIFERAEGFRPGAYVVVYGAGPIGLAAIGLARAAGASRVIAFEIAERRRQLAQAVGADEVYDPRDVRPHEVILEHTHGEGADMHIEAAGAPEKTIPEMEKSLAINGKIAVVGRAARRVPMFLEILQIRRGQIYGAQGHSGHGIFPSVIRMIGAGLLHNEKFITTRYPLDQGIEAVEKLSAARDEGKIMLKP